MKTKLHKQIAGDLGISGVSLGAVHASIQRIFEKLHVRSHAGAMMKYARK